MERVDLTGIWRDGEFYKVKAYDQCAGCVFLPDQPKEGVACYDALDCEKGVSTSPKSKFIYINTDDASVAKHVKDLLDG